MLFSLQLLDHSAGSSPRTRRRLRLRNHLIHSPQCGRAGKAAAVFYDLLRASLVQGASAARQVVIPIMLVQVLMVALVLGFFHMETVQTMLRNIVAVKNQSGLLFAFASMGSISVLAEILRRCGSPDQQGSFLRDATFGFVVFGFLGMATDLFYLLQNAMWGWLPPTGQIPAKVLTDQFLYTVIFANPYQTLLYVFKDTGFQPEAFFKRLRPFRLFYVREMLAVLVTNWAFWIPTTAVLYCLPTELQFVICQLAIVIWVLLLTTLTKRSA